MKSKFVDCKIIVNSEKDKKDFIRACKHLHDFSVFFDKNKKITNVIYEFGSGNVKYKDRDLGKMSPNIIELKKDDSGISLGLDEYPFINFLAGLYDCEDPSIRDKFIIVNNSDKIKKYKVFGVTDNNKFVTKYINAKNSKEAKTTAKRKFNINAYRATKDIR